MSRKGYSEQFQTDAARLVREQGYSVKQAATSLGVSQGSIRAWLLKSAAGASAGSPAATVDQLQRDLVRLREENRRLLMEREILKKAAAFFAREQP